MSGSARVGVSPGHDRDHDRGTTRSAWSSKRRRPSTALWEDSTSTEDDRWTYEVVPAEPLPLVDLSCSLKSRFIPGSLLQRIDVFLVRYARALLIGYCVALIASTIVPLVPPLIGQVAACVSITLGLPLGLGSLSGLRYDVVRLLTTTYDFWFFLVLNTFICGMMATYFGDLRMARMVLDWTGIQNLVMADAQLRAVRRLTFMAVIGVSVLTVQLASVLFDLVQNAHDFQLFASGDHTVMASNFLANGIITLTILVLRFVYRKRHALKRDHAKSAIVECVGYRVRIKLVTHRLQTIAVVPKATHQRQHEHLRPTVQSRRPVYIQQMQLMPIEERFDATRLVVPLCFNAGKRLSKPLLILLYALGCFGFLLVVVGILLEVQGSFATMQARNTINTVFLVGIGSSVLFCVVFLGLLQRDLVRWLLSSFDFLFYSIQVTLAHMAVCALFHWDYRCFGVLSSWLWIHWFMLLDALTPVMRAKLRFHGRLTLPVVTVFTAGQTAILVALMFFPDVCPDDVTLWQGTVLHKAFEFRVRPFLFSRVATTLLWSCRMLWRLTVTKGDDLVILRGRVMYRNYFKISQTSKSHQRSRAWSTLLPPLRHKGQSGAR
ncbi:TPA: hypothetical protein N0F65_006957 [Lagenidium giganteum]|uniref:Uncharacterized protein n=1 Tax=Lagenidium giganteum TaxID=4803 RepID=A0AAV2ZQ42_9STRA|nr:TPA: hypothetical protein N0F65_006957 [Lagenidium giganteum]